MARYGREEQAVPRRCTIRARIRATVTSCFQELRSRQGGKGNPAASLDALVVATLTRHQVRETGARARAMLNILLDLPHALTAKGQMCTWYCRFAAGNAGRHFGLDLVQSVGRESQPTLWTKAATDSFVLL